VNTGGRGLITQRKSGMCSIRGGATRPAIESHREENRCQKGNGDDRLSNGWAGSVRHGSEYSLRTWLGRHALLQNSVG